MRLLQSFVLSTLLLGPSLFGASIVNTFTGIATGTIGESTFTSAEFVITGNADTSEIEAYSDGFVVNHSSASIFIAGLGSFTFLTPTASFVNNTNGTVGFGRAGGADLYDFEVDVPGADTWDMQTSFSFEAFAILIQWADSPVDTSGGVIEIQTNPEVSGTFSSVVGGGEIPEPSSLALVGAGIAASAFLRRKM